MNSQFIAEASSNHAQNLDRCLQFVEAAAQLGCFAVKFQLFKLDKLFCAEVLERSENHRQRRQWELPEAFIPKIAQRCRDSGIAFCCTPFYLEAVEFLAPYVDFFKIASYDILRDDLIAACARTGKPLVISTGMAIPEEISHCVAVARREGCKALTLLHCVSAYPTPPGECNLAAIETLRNENGCDVGWSDHTVSPAVIYRAVHHWQATMVEFHLDLDGKGAEFAPGHCWLPQQIGPVIEACSIGFAADGDGRKLPSSSEVVDRAWRADPSDGLRPLLETRKVWQG